MCASLRSLLVIHPIFIDLELAFDDTFDEVWVGNAFRLCFLRQQGEWRHAWQVVCLLYTSDAADE